MKRSIFCPMITNEDIGGGIKSTISLLNGLQELGHQVTVVVPQECSYLSKFNYGIRIVFFKINPSISLFKPLTYLRLCKLIRYEFYELKRGTLFLASDRPALMLALFISQKSTIYYISRGWFYTNWSAKFLRLFLFPRVSHFVGISKKQFELMVKYSNDNQKVSLIENGIEMPMIRSSPFQKNIINIATIGGICERKNQLQCIELIKNLKKKYTIQLLIFGTTFTEADKNYLKILKQYINSNNLDQDVFFMGHETNFDLIYTQADIVVSTAIEEGFGRTLIEAMSYGVPVIANRLSGGPETIINHKNDGLLFNGTIEDLVANTVSLIENRTLRSQIMRNSIKKVKNNYTTEIMVNNYSKLIESEK